MRPIRNASLRRNAGQRDTNQVATTQKKSYVILFNRQNRRSSSTPQVLPKITLIHSLHSTNSQVITRYIVRVCILDLRHTVLVHGEIPIIQGSETYPQPVTNTLLNIPSLNATRAPIPLHQELRHLLVGPLPIPPTARDDLVNIMNAKSEAMIRRQVHSHFSTTVRDREFEVDGCIHCTRRV